MKDYKKIFLLLTGFLVPVACSLAQPLTQSIRGAVTDAVTNEPLIGATITVLDLPEITGTITDTDGRFLLEKIPIGRHTLQCSYIGYASRSEILLLNSAKEGMLDFRLQAASIELATVVVRPPGEALNPLSMVSVRSISPEETQYFPAGGNDFGRSVVSLPGVQPSKDNENDVVIRGNSGAAIGWRLEGIDILNPNHFARKGSSGGGITIFSISVLGEADFSTGAFPAEYGNALAGVFDLRFRKGNKERREYTFRAGMLGLDLAAEGPFGGGTGNKRGSYLFNYRYSTLGMLNEMGLHLVGERISNDFQDLSFNIDFPANNNKSRFNLWGLGGLSVEEEVAIENPEKWQVLGDSAQHRFGSRMGVIGLSHTLQPDNNSFLKTSVAVVAQQSYQDDDQLTSDQRVLRKEEEDYRQGRLSLASVYSRSISRRVYLKAGLQLAGISYNFRRDTVKTEQTLTPKIDGTGNTLLLEPYMQWQFTPLPRWTFNVGIHALYFGLTRSFSPEPRLGFRVALGEKQSLGMAYGLHSMYVPPGSYFTVVGSEQPNLDLDLIKAHHLVLSYDRIFAGQFRLHGELYYQHLFNVPVGVDAPRTYWLFNTIEGYADRKLVSEGKGDNYGLDVLFEKYFRQGAFFLLSGSVFNSTFQPLDGKTYNTQYNSRFNGSFTAGKEWEFKSRNSSLQLGIRTMYNHGMASTPLLDLTAPTDEPIFDESRPFSERAPAYFRIDTRMAFRKNSPKASWLLALDVQNVTNRKNKRAFNWNYDLVQMTWYRKNQAGVIPVLSFQIDF